MKVLLATACTEGVTRNPYTLQLRHSLARHPQVSSLQHGISWLWNRDVTFNIIHVQWPEEIFSWAVPSELDLEKLASALAYWRSKGTQIVVTVHNEFPHAGDTVQFRKLYSMVYESADGFVHLGSTSPPIVDRRFGAAASQSVDHVIYHGDYSCYPNVMTRDEARRRMGIRPGQPTILAFGHIRLEEELNLLLQGFADYRMAGKKEAVLVVAGRLPHATRRSLKHFYLRRALYFGGARRLHERFIADEEVQHFMNAADVVVVPRLQHINSGTVPLAFTFGKVAVGPDRAVIGEMLRAANNPTFNPDQRLSVADALAEGLQLAGEGLGDANRRWAQENLNWEGVAHKHFLLYRELLGASGFGNRVPTKIQVGCG